MGIDCKPNATDMDMPFTGYVVDSVVNDKLIEKIEERDRTIQDMQVLLQDVQSMHALAQAEIGDQHRKIKMLEDNLDRARSQYLEQLRAIIQMLEPLATHEDKTLYLSHFGKAAMVYLIQRVIYANIKKLDPKPPTYDNDLLN